MTLKQIINTWAKRLWQKLRGKKEEPKYDLYQIPNGPGFFVPKGTTPPQFGKNISIQIPDSRKPIRPPAPPFCEQKHPDKTIRVLSGFLFTERRMLI